MASSKVANTGVKRDHEGQPISRTPIAVMFDGFRSDLEEHHDRRLRIHQAGQLITKHSKRIIFALHRARDLGQPLDSSIETEVANLLKLILTQLSTISPEIQGINRHRYAPQLRGLEELVEALVFAHYLRTQTLLSPEALAEILASSNVEISQDDYMYGVHDLFGEMMRFATTSVARGGTLGGSLGLPDKGQGDSKSRGDSANEDGDASPQRTVLDDIRELAGAFEILPPVSGRVYHLKMKAMRESVQKVEKLGYDLRVRSSERPAGWMPDLDGGREAEEND